MRELGEVSVALHGGSVVLLHLVLLPFVLVAIVAFVKRRHLQPIRSRLPLHSAATALVTLIWLALEAGMRTVPHRMPCWLCVSSAHLVLPMLLVMYGVRALWLLATFNHAFEALRRVHCISGDSGDTTVTESVASAAATGAGASDNRRTPVWAWRPDWTLLRAAWPRNLLLLGALLVHLCQYLPFVIFNENVRTCTCANCAVKGHRWVVLSVILFYGVLLSYIAVQLKSVVDNLAFKTELKVVGAGATIGVIIWFVTATFDPLAVVFFDKYPLEPIFLQMLGFFVFIGASILYPLYLTFKFENRYVGKDTAGAESSLRDWIGTEDGNKAFAEFLSLEFSLENLLFYEDVVAYKRKSDSLLSALQAARRPASIYKIQAAMYNVALGIYCNYVSQDAALEVNLKDKIVEAICFELHVPRYGVSQEFFRSNNSRSAEYSSSALNYDVEMDFHPKDTSFEKIQSPVSYSTGAEQRELSCTRKFVYPQDMRRLAEHIKFKKLPHIFDEAADEVYLLMNSDSFRRFQLSGTYSELLRQFKHNEVTNKALRDLDVL